MNEIVKTLGFWIVVFYLAFMVIFILPYAVHNVVCSITYPTNSFLAKYCR